MSAYRELAVSDRRQTHPLTESVHQARPSCTVRPDPESMHSKSPHKIFSVHLGSGLTRRGPCFMHTFGEQARVGRNSETANWVGLILSYLHLVNTVTNGLP
jgi:hypothetical protein